MTIIIIITINFDIGCSATYNAVY